jgi:integrase/recombinase XerD
VLAGEAIMTKFISWTRRVEAYVAYRRDLGFALKIDEKILLQFARFAEKMGHKDRLNVALATQWARISKSQAPITWGRRLDVLRGFAKYCQRFEADTEVPPQNLFGPTHRRLVPHIYTDAEILALLAAADNLLPINGLRPATCRTIFGLLASSGLRISEAVGLTRADVDLSAGVLTIREAKFHKSRLVPLHTTVTAALRSYAQLRDRIVSKPNSEHFFLLDNGKPANQRTILYALHQLCKKLGWQPRGDYSHHRLHDLRHTFIVRSTLGFYQQGIDIDRAVLALSTYVGHAKVADTYWYFTGIPELMDIAAERFHQYSQQEVSL